MARRASRRAVSLLLSALLLLMMAFAFTQEASAASGTKTIYVRTQTNTTYIGIDGKVEKGVIKDTYDKNGLLKQSTSTGITEYYKVVFKRNKAGAITGTKGYNEDGKLVSTSSRTLKNGNPTKIKTYQVDPATGKKTLSATITYTYKKGKISKSVQKDKDGSTSTSTYYSNGNIKKHVYKTKDSEYVYNYNKKGLPTTSSSKMSYDGFTMTSTSKHDVTVNKKGYITKEVITTKEVSNGTTSTQTEINTHKYTFKSGRMTKQVSEHSFQSGDYSSKSKSTSTYKYKKIKVPKKYLPYAG